MDTAEPVIAYKDHRLEKKDKFVDWDLHYTDRKLIYTAIKRATLFKHAYINNGKSQKLNGILIDIS